jgi:hypothetical protein
MNDEWPQDEEIVCGMSKLERLLHRSWKCQLLCVDAPRGRTWRATVAPNTFRKDVPFSQRVNSSSLIEGKHFCLAHNGLPFDPGSIPWDTRSLIQEHLYLSFVDFYQRVNPCTRERIVDRLQYQFHGYHRIRNEDAVFHVYNGTLEFNLSIPKEMYENKVDMLVLKALNSGIMLWLAQIEWNVQLAPETMDPMTLRCFPIHIRPVDQNLLYNRMRLKCTLRYTKERKVVEPRSLDQRFMAMLTDSNGYDDIKRHISNRLERTLQNKDVQIKFIKHHVTKDSTDCARPARIHINYVVKIYFPESSNDSISEDSDMDTVDTLLTEDLFSDD